MKGFIEVTSSADNNPLSINVTCILQFYAVKDKTELHMTAEGHHSASHLIIKVQESYAQTKALVAAALS